MVKENDNEVAAIENDLKDILSRGNAVNARVKNNNQASLKNYQEKFTDPSSSKFDNKNDQLQEVDRQAINQQTEVIIADLEKLENKCYEVNRRAG